MPDVFTAHSSMFRLNLFWASSQEPAKKLFRDPEMVALKDIIKAEKRVIDLGRWGQGHISRSAFPITSSKNKHYKYGPEYRWRVVKFECLNHTCRILLLLCEPRLIFRATLGVEVEGSMCILCDHEFHNSEPGWHCHLTLEDLGTVAEIVKVGIRRGHTTRWPKAKSKHSRIEFTVSEANAVSLAANLFRFEAQGSLI